jgi:hypothetical protein
MRQDPTVGAANSRLQLPFALQKLTVTYGEQLALLRSVNEIIGRRVAGQRWKR